MKQVLKWKLIALGISLALMACNNDEKKADTAAANTDTTATAKTTPDSTAAPKVENLDAAKVASALYTVAKDTMGIRVLNVLYKPGDSSALHSHPDVVLYVIDGGKGEFTGKDGTKQIRELKSGMAMTVPAETHSVKNIGTTTLKAILVEVNRPNTAAPAQDAAMDAVKVAPTLYKKISDTMNIRVLMATYKPGASSAMHSHPDYAIYDIEGGKAEFTTKDGKKLQNNMTKGTINIIPADSHAVKNNGNTTIKVLIVEVNRPLK